MPDYPTNLPNRPTIWAFSPEAEGANRLTTSGQNTPTSAAYPTSNLAMFIPFALHVPYEVRRVWWANGTTVSGNVDCGVYRADQTKVISCGSTAQTTVSVIQSVSVTYTLLLPGNYYLAIAMNNTTGHLLRVGNPNTPNGQTMGQFEQTTAFALPSTATLATWNAAAYTPIFGITSRTVI